eukprot:Rmarinus@m.6175
MSVSKVATTATPKPPVQIERGASCALATAGTRGTASHALMMTNVFLELTFAASMRPASIRTVHLLARAMKDTAATGSPASTITNVTCSRTTATTTPRAQTPTVASSATASKATKAMASNVRTWMNAQRVLMPVASMRRART